MLAWVIARAAMTGRDVIVATSDRPVDDPLAELVESLNTSVFRGAHEDVLGRAHAVAEQFGSTAIVRISGDSPFIDPVLVSTMIDLYESQKADIATNVHPRSFPPGQSVEVIGATALRHAADQAVLADDREHVTTYFYRHADQFRIVNHAVEPAYDDRLDFAVDTPADLAFANALAARVKPNADLAALTSAVDLQPDKPAQIRPLHA